VINNNGFWIGWLDLLTPSFTISLNHNQLQSLSINFSRTLLPWLPRARSILVLRLTSESESESYVTTDGQSASLSWNKAPIWDLRPDLYYCQTIAGLLMWGAVSDERTGLSFTIATGTRQRSHSRVLVPWDLRPYFTVSNSPFHLSSGAGTIRQLVADVPSGLSLTPPQETKTKALL
jgi:hypothetical protein